MTRNLTPGWFAILPILAQAIERQQEDAASAAYEELSRALQALDSWNDAAPRLRAALVAALDAVNRAELDRAAQHLAHAIRELDL